MRPPDCSKLAKNPKNGSDVTSVKTGDSEKVTLFLAHYTCFSRSCDIIVNFGFGGNRCFFEFNTIASNIPDPALPKLLFFYVFTECHDTLSSFKLLKLGQWKVWSENDFITYRLSGWAGLKMLAKKCISSTQECSTTLKDFSY